MNSAFIKGASVSLLFASFAAGAADWVALGLDSRGNAWYIDRTSVVRGTDQVQAWKRIAFREPAPQLGSTDSTVKVALVLDVTDCNQRQVDVKALTLLDGDGAVLAAHEHSRGQGLPWPSGGQALVQEKAVALLCSDAWRESN